MKSFILLASLATFATSAPAQTFTVLHSFSCSGVGNRPGTGLVLDGDSLYGTTSDICSYWNGTVFKVGTNGTGFTTLHSSTNPDWRHPNGLIVSEGAIYGTTTYGDDGSGLGFGTVFRMDTDGSNYVVLKSFTGPDGRDPGAGLISSGDTLYGTTILGGTSGSGGTIFKIRKDGTGFTSLHSFWEFSTNHCEPSYPMAELILGGAMLYGTSRDGGTNDRGSVFKLSTNGSDFSVIHNFSGEDGMAPYGPLLWDAGKLYGTTASGGTLNGGTVFKMNTDGSDYVVLHNFLSAGTDGPRGKIVLRGQTLYGTCVRGGGVGMVFKVKTDGSDYQMLHGFDGPSDGGGPVAGVMLGGDTLYGAAEIGGSLNGGTVFALQLPTEVLNPKITSVIGSIDTITIFWNSVSGAVYQVQAATEIPTAAWTNLGLPVTATNGTLSATDFIGSDPQKFYRVMRILP